MENANNGGDDSKEDENDRVLQLMIENEVLNCEKMKAETEVEVWKTKCSQLQLRVIELENILAASKCVSGTPLADTPPLEHLADVDGGKRGTSAEAELKNSSRVRKHLAFSIEGNPNKKMAPSTPAGVRPVVLGVIDVDDSDDDTDLGLEKNELSSKSNIQEGQSNDNDNISYEGNVSFISTPRRRRSYNVVTSDAESDDNDDVPISRLRNKSMEQKRDFHSDRYHMTNIDSRDEVESSANGRRLRRLRKCEEKSLPEKCSPGNEENSSESSESEGDSLNGFIISNSEVSESDAASDGASESDDAAPSTEVSSDPEDVNLDYKEIISRIRRNRDHKVKWDFEADMLAAFSKDPELCIRAVCALYRQQTSEEKFAKGTLVQNGRGFSQCDALRGSKLAEFLIDGDSQGDVKKSVEELQKYDPKGLEVCRQLASRYSKQLFEIYKSKEDPFFLPS